MRIVKLTKESKNNILEGMLKRSPNNYGSYESVVADILANIKENGDKALFEYTKKFDKFDLNKDNIRVTEEEIKDAYSKVSEDLLTVIKKSLVNVKSYHEKQRQNSWFNSTEDGTILGQKVTPLESGWFSAGSACGGWDCGDDAFGTRHQGFPASSESP